ncbi:MAG: pilin [Candidatus Paceibacterota bacterium]
MKKIIAASLLSIVALTNSSVALADTQGGNPQTPQEAQQIQLHNPLGDSNRDLGSLLTNILNKAVNFIITPILVLMIIVGAWQMLVSAGNPEGFKKGQRTIVYAVIGFAVILLANGISALIKYVLGL